MPMPLNGSHLSHLQMTKVVVLKIFSHCYLQKPLFCKFTAIRTCLYDFFKNRKAIVTCKKSRFLKLHSSARYNGYYFLKLLSLSRDNGSKIHYQLSLQREMIENFQNNTHCNVQTDFLCWGNIHRLLPDGKEMKIKYSLHNNRRVNPFYYCLRRVHEEKILLYNSRAAGRNALVVQHEEEHADESVLSRAEFPFQHIL